MAFPRAKANLYEYGFHVPLAIRWGDKVKGARVSHDLVGFTDLAPTILEACGIESPKEYPMSGQSILSLLISGEEGIIEPQRDAIYASRERHSSSRFHSLSYPQRAIRTQEYLYIRNFTPERWPAGAPQKYGTSNYPSKVKKENQELGDPHGGYHDIDPCPSLTFLVEHRESPDIAPYFQWAIGMRPKEELFNVKKDTGCLDNLANDPSFSSIKESLSARLETYLTETKDPRILGEGDIWESYPRYSRIRLFPQPQWAKKHPEKVPKQDWREARMADFR